jgi:hypothetical protein
MVRRIVVSLCVLAGFVPVGTARADLSRVDASGLPAALAAQCQTRDTGLTHPLLPASPGVLSELGGDSSPLLLPTTENTHSEPAPSDTLVIDGPPSSMSLFLSGLLTVGAWHIGRSAAHWHPQTGWMPEWYHTGGPVQIGTAVPFDFHAGLAVVCECDSLLPPTVGPCIVPVAVDSDGEPGLLHLVADPVRGPPC